MPDSKLHLLDKSFPPWTDHCSGVQMFWRHITWVTNVQTTQAIIWAYLTPFLKYETLVENRVDRG